MPFFKVVVTTQPTRILPFNPRRKTVTIINLGDYRIFISQNPTNIISEGFPIYPLEGITLDEEDGDEPEYALYAQTETGEVDVRVQEGVKKT